MKTLVFVFVLLVVLVSGTISYLSIRNDPLGGEPFQNVAVEADSFEKMLASVQAKLETEAQAKAKAIAEAKKKQAAETAAKVAGGTAPENMPIVGQTPQALEVDPTGGITATVVPE